MYGRKLFAHTFFVAHKHLKPRLNDKTPKLLIARYKGVAVGYGCNSGSGEVSGSCRVDKLT